MIPNLSGAALWLSNSFELSLLAKATLILLAGLAVTALARTARASARHLVIATSFAALVALPLLIAFVPAMAIDVPIAKAQTAFAALGNPNEGVAPTNAERAARRRDERGRARAARPDAGAMGAHRCGAPARSCS